MDLRTIEQILEAQRWYGIADLYVSIALRPLERAPIGLGMMIVWLMT